MNDTGDERNPDFIDKALGSLDHVLDIVHDRVLRPIFLAGRIAAYGLIIALAALVFVIALIIGLLRVLNVYLFAGHVWISYLIVGVLSLSVGLFIWRRRKPVQLRKP